MENTSNSTALRNKIVGSKILTNMNVRYTSYIEKKYTVVYIDRLFRSDYI